MPNVTTWLPTYVKVKQYVYRPGEALRVLGVWSSQIAKQSAHEGGNVNPTQHPPLPYSSYSFLLEADPNYVKVKWSRYRPGVAQRVGRDIALLFHDRGTRRGWVVSSMPRPHFTPGKVLVPILQETGWAPGPVLAGGKSRPHRDSIPDCPAPSQSLYRLSYRAHIRPM